MANISLIFTCIRLIFLETKTIKKYKKFAVASKWKAFDVLQL